MGVSKIKAIPIILRVIIVNFFDLFLRLHKKYTIEVKDLNEEEIGFVLSKLGIEKDRLSKSLMELLRVPLHLKVFSDIYKEGASLISLNTLQDLYDELWNQRTWFWDRQ